MPSVPSSGTKRKRAPHTRSRLGCQTCRTRRVRCDQTRPACRNCTVTGRSCDGYVIRQPCDGQRINTNIVAKTPSISVYGDEEEHRYLLYFQRYTAVQFSGLYDHDFWCTLVLQIGAGEPCIRHAVIALGSLHETFQAKVIASRITQSGPVRSARYACEHYVKAIGILKANIADRRRGAVVVSLLCCILFVGFEWLRGSYTDAYLHLSNGLEVLRQWVRSQDDRINRSTTMSTAPSLIRSTLAPIFMRLALQARTFSDGRLPWESSLNNYRCQNVKIDSLHAARDSLDALLGQIYLTPDQPPYTTMSSNVRKTRTSYSRRLAKWFNSYISYVTTSQLDAVADRNLRITILDATHEIIKIMLATNHSDDQMQFDRFLPNFRLVLDRAEVFVGTHVAPLFSINIAIIPILYFVGLKCRDPVVRRRALTLLSITARREGVWDGQSSARIVREVIAIEEEDVQGVCELEGGLNFGAADVRVYSRIRRLKFETNLDRHYVSMAFSRHGESEWSPEKVLTW